MKIFMGGKSSHFKLKLSNVFEINYLCFGLDKVRNYLFTQLSDGGGLNNIICQSPNGKSRRQTSVCCFRFTL